MSCDQQLTVMGLWVSAARSYGNGVFRPHHAVPPALALGDRTCRQELQGRRPSASMREAWALRADRQQGYPHGGGHSAETHLSYTVPYRPLPQSCSEPLGVPCRRKPSATHRRAQVTPVTCDSFPTVTLHGLGAQVLESITWESHPFLWWMLVTQTKLVQHKGHCDGKKCPDRGLQGGPWVLCVTLYQHRSPCQRPFLLLVGSPPITQSPRHPGSPLLH